MRKLLLCFFFILAFGELKAAVFTVTSNANNGIGSLREIIDLANANGTAITDYIYFNLPGNSKSDITIGLENELPTLTSNIIIDATTQPFAALANPNIKVSIIRIAADYFNGLRLDNASNIEIYGLSFSNFKSDPAGAIEDKKGGIFLYHSSNIKIGAPNKPNCFSACYAGILSPFVIPRFDVENVKISSNIFGLGENGLNAVPNETGIDLSFLKNSVIGGDLPIEGNLIATNTKTGIALGGADGNIKIANNTIGLDKNFSLKSSSVANGIYVNGAESKPEITDNIICGQAEGILLNYVNGGFKIAKNRIGTGVLGTENYFNNIGIHINFSLAGVIGGTKNEDQNTIAYNKTAVIVEISYPVTILKNSIYCNDAGILFKNLPAGKSITQSKITSITTNGASGKYLPNSLIELFYIDGCQDCQGKTWLTSLTTNADGDWNYIGPISGKLTSTGTNQDGATSTFSKPLIDDSNVQKFGTYCGLSTASIKNIKVYDASVVQWFNAAGDLVGTSIDLENIIAGTYYLKAGQLGACDVISAKYTIDAAGNGIDDSKKVITDTYCNATNGSIKQIGVVNNLSKTWYNSSGNAVAITNDLENVPAGNYFFKAGTGACEIISSTYTIKNVTKNFLVKDYDIAFANCSKQNGKISIFNYQADIPTEFTWKNQRGEVVGSEEDLINVFTGTYTLYVSDGADCSNVAGVFNIELTPLPVIDLTKLQSFIGCDGKTVSVSGVEVNGLSQPFKCQWMDNEGNVVYIGLNFKNTKPGKYHLLVTDLYNCEVESETIDFTQLEKKEIKIPSSITPNGDGINDTWKIDGVENYPAAEFSIFNRNGNRLYFSKGYQKEFDGTYNGKPLSIGVYFYMIDLKTDCGKLSGALTILE